MKKILAVLIALVFLVSPLAIAQEAEQPNLSDTDVQEITEETGTSTEEEAGVTPDQPVLWGFEKLQERISLALTLNKQKKAEKLLKFADERLKEMNEMAKQKKLKALARAEEDHAELVAEAEENQAESGEEATAETQTKLDRHIQILEKVKEKLEAKGVPTQGIENALFRAEAFKQVKAEYKSCMNETKATEDSVARKEASKTCLQERKQLHKEKIDEAKQLMEQNREQVKERIRETREKTKDIEDQEEVEDVEETEVEEQDRGAKNREGQ